MNLMWYFPPLMGGNDNDSANGSGIDLFTTDPLGNLAREIIQNSLDARKGSNPVIVELCEFETESPASIPCHKELEEHISKWIAGNPADETVAVDHELQFHRRALNALKGQTIVRWLRASDFNTKGLDGIDDPDNKRKPWYLFVKANGQNAKGSLSGGSKGLGKNAIFANSDIHTIFVETMSQSGRGSIGIAKLSSIEDDPTIPSPEKKRGVGYLTLSDTQYAPPIMDVLNLQDGYQRTELGTDLFIPCFAAEEDWAKQVITEAISSFLPAFYDGDLILRIKTLAGEEIEISRENLFKAVRDDRYILKRRKKELGTYWGVLSSEKTTRLTYNKKPGFEMTLLVRGDSNDYTNKVLAFRYGTKMRVCAVPGVNAYTNFTGILLIQGEEICARLRSLEDATHSKWPATKWKDTGYTKEQIDEATNAYIDFVCRQMENFGISKDSEESDFEWAKNEGFSSKDNDPEFYGGASGDDGLPSKDFGFLRDKRKPEPKKKPLKRRGTVPDEDGDASAFVDAQGVILPVSLDESPSEIADPLLPTPQNPTGPKTEESVENDKPADNPPVLENEDDSAPSKDKQGQKKLRKQIATAFCKMPAQNPEDGAYLLIFSPRRSGRNVKIEIFQAGTGKINETPSILSASFDGAELETKDNNIFMDEIVQGERYAIDLTANVHSNCVWEVNIYADA